MSMLKFSNAFDRAKAALESNKSLVEAPTIKVAASTITFAYEHIHLLEEQLGAHQQLSADWKAEAKRTQRQIEALMGVLATNYGVSLDELKDTLARA